MNLSEFIKTFKTSPVEKFGVVYFAADHKTHIGVKMIASGDAGSIHSISMDRIIQEARRLGAKGMTLMHNHPKANKDTLRPSVKDLETTFEIHDLAKTVGVPVLNHIIYGTDNSAFSFIHNGIQI